MRINNEDSPPLNDAMLPRAWAAIRHRTDVHFRAFASAHSAFPTPILRFLHNRFRRQSIPRTHEELFARRHQAGWLSNILGVFERLSQASPFHRAGVTNVLENMMTLDMPRTLAERSSWDQRLAAIETKVALEHSSLRNLDDFKRLVLGKTKQSVIAAVGSPTVRRRQGKDLWGYHDAGKRGSAKLIHFQGGIAHAVYQVG